MMARRSRVAPESSLSEENRSGNNSGKLSSNNNSLLAFENTDLSSAITGKVIEANDNTNENGLHLNNSKKNPKSKTSGKPHKRIARSVSEVVEEKQKQERNVFSRFANSYRRNGVYGIFLGITDEIDLLKYRCNMGFTYITNKVTCAKQIEEE